MNGRLLLALVTSAGLALPAAGAYKWVDKDGNVQYSDRPPPGVQAEEIKPPPAVDTTAARKKLEKTQKKAATRAKEAETAKAEAEKSAAETAARKTACEQARHAVERLSTAQRIYQTTQGGDRVRLGAEEVEKRLAEARKSEAENCK
jgi:hypothetical protein